MQHAASNPEALALRLGDSAEHLRRTADSGIIDEFYPSCHFSAESLRAAAANADVEYMGRWRIAAIVVEDAPGGRRALVEIETI